MIADPFATHLPVLWALGRALAIQRVLEFGAGQYSTAEFLDRRRFPVVEQVASFEASQGWADRLAALPGLDDPRLALTVVADTADVAATADLDCFDLIFIDNGKYQDDRSPVIEAIARRRPAALTVIHDFEQGAYQQAAAGFEHVYFWRGLTPWTAVLWNGSRDDVMSIEVQV